MEIPTWEWHVYVLVLGHGGHVDHVSQPSVRVQLQEDGTIHQGSDKGVGDAGTKTVLQDIIISLDHLCLILKNCSLVLDILALN